MCSEAGAFLPEYLILCIFQEKVTRTCLKNSGMHKWRGIFVSIKAFFCGNTLCIARKINAERRKKIRRLSVLSFFKHALILKQALIYFTFLCAYSQYLFDLRTRQCCGSCCYLARSFDKFPKATPHDTPATSAG